MKNGVPLHAAFGMTKLESDDLKFDRVERSAIAIIFSEYEGSKFNWSSLTFEDKS